MKCAKIQQKLTLSEELAEHERKHLRACPKCSEFHKDLQRLVCLGNIKTPVNLKNNTLDSSLFMLKKKEKRFWEFWFSPKLAVVLSVISGMCLIGLAFVQLYCDHSDMACWLATAFILFVILQNIVAALCFPILLPHKVILKYNL